MDSLAAQAREDDYTLLVVTQIDEESSEKYIERHAATLRRMIREQDLVGLLHLSFERRGGVDVFVPANDPQRPKASYCHPQLASYINWYPTFILVRDKNYFDRDSELEVRVFNRVIEGGNYKPGKNAYVPANIIMWISDEMDKVYGQSNAEDEDLEESAETAPGLEAEHATGSRGTSWLAELDYGHSLLRRRASQEGRIVDSL